MKKNRETYIDAVKGLTITLVVLHHVISGTNTALGLPSWFMELYKLTVPIRMPLFFLVAGLFAQKSLTLPFKKFVDSKLLYFAYFYILWNTIDVITRATLSKFTNNKVDIIEVFYFPIYPSFALWFLYILFFYFLLAYILRKVDPRIQVLMVSVVALATQYTIYYDLSVVIRNGIKFLPFFFIGIYYSKSIRNFVETRSSSAFTLIFLLVYVIIASLVFVGIAEFNNPVYFYPAAFCSILFFLNLFKLLSKFKVVFLFDFIGKRSLYIYVMHFLPVAAFRVIFNKLFGIEHLGVLILTSTFCSVCCCIIAFEAFKNIKFVEFLFKRPNWAKA